MFDFQHGVHSYVQETSFTDKQQNQPNHVFKRTQAGEVDVWAEANVSIACYRAVYLQQEDLK